MVREILPRELQSLLSTDKEYILMDVRQPWEFKICYLPDSLNIPLTELHKAHTRLSAVKKIVTICHHGVRSRQAAMLLEQLGYLDVVSLQGGIEAWARDINPKMERY